MQVIRIDQVDRNASLGTTVTFFDDDNQRWAITNDVIELTEEREDGTARFDPIWHGDVRRFVSDWKPVDDD